MAELGARFGFSFNVVGQLTAPASARSAASKNSTQRHKIALSIVGHSRKSASPKSNLLDYRGSDKQNPEPVFLARPLRHCLPKDGRLRRRLRISKSE